MVQESASSSPRRVFVFGSNLAGRHGRGAALHARRHFGARLGAGQGPTGDAYAIPTKDAELRVLSIEEIKPHVAAFIRYAASRPLETFEVTRVGCGLAGYRDEQIAPLFTGAPTNCLLPYGWRELAA